MKTIVDKFEGATKQSENLMLNSQLAQGCLNANETGSKVPDIDDMIFGKDVKEIVEDCRKYGIEEITFSSTKKGAFDTLALFEEEGCTVQGLTKVTGIKYNGEKETRNAIKIRI